MYGLNSFYTHFFLLYAFFILVISIVHKGNHRGKIVLFTLPLFLLSALRGESVGGDLENYLPNFDAYYYLNNVGDLLGYSSHEPGYVLFAKMISLISPSHRFYLIITSFCCLLGPFFLIYKYSNAPGLSFIMYYSLGFYTNTMNNIRQSLAISICCFAVPFILDKQYRKFILLVAIATMFHYSAALFLFSFFLSGKELSFKRFFFVLGSGIGIYCVMGLSLLQYVMTFAIFKYDPEALLDKPSSGWSLLFFYGVLLVLEILVYVAQEKKLEPDARTHYSALIYFQLMAVLCQLYAPIYSSMTRAALYFYIPIIIAVPNFIGLFRRNRPLLSMIVSVLCFIYMCTFVYVYSETTGSNSQGVIPYVLIDEKIY